MKNRYVDKLKIFLSVSISSCLFYTILYNIAEILIFSNFKEGVDFKFRVVVGVFVTLFVYGLMRITINIPFLNNVFRFNVNVIIGQKPRPQDIGLFISSIVILNFFISLPLFNFISVLLSNSYSITMDIILVSIACSLVSSIVIVNIMNSNSEDSIPIK